MLGRDERSFQIFDEADEMRGVEILLKKLGIYDFVKEKEVSTEVLEKLVSSFSKIPYENLTKRFFTFQSPYELAEVFVNYGGGGTCFPLVYALKRMLDFIGFSSYIVLADRTYAPSSHCFIVVDEVSKGEGNSGRTSEDKLYVIDVGFSIFRPVEVFPGRTTKVKVPQGEICFGVSSGDKIEVWSLFPNGHRKFRYSAKFSPTSKDEFIDAWRETFKFEMMNHAIVVKLFDDILIYIKDNFVHFIKDAVSKNFKLSTSEVINILKKIGVSPEIYLKAVSELGLVQ